MGEKFNWSYGSNIQTLVGKLNKYYENYDVVAVERTANGGYYALLQLSEAQLPQEGK